MRFVKVATHPLFLLLSAVFIIQVATMPKELYPVDAPAVRAEAASLVNYGHLWISDLWVRRFYWARPGQFIIQNRRTGLWYSKYGIMNTLIDAVPLFLERRITGGVFEDQSPVRLICFNMMFTLLALLSAFCLYRIAREYTHKRFTGVIYALIVFYATFIWNYLRAQTSEAIQILFFLAFYLCAVRTFRSAFAKGAGWAWIWLFCLILTKTFFLFLIPIWVTALFLKLRSLKKIDRIFIYCFLPVVIILLTLGWVQWLKFGSPFLSGYHESDKGYHRVPWNLWAAAKGYLFSWKRSLFIHFPPLLFAPLFMLEFFRKFKAEFLFGAAVFLSAFFLIGNLARWDGEWCYGPRYFAFILPVLSLPLLIGMERRGEALLKTALGAACILSVGLQGYVNRLPFFAYQRLDPSYLYPSVRESFFQGPNGYVLFRLSPYQNHPEALPYLPDLRRKLSPKRQQLYLEDVKDYLRRRNLFLD